MKKSAVNVERVTLVRIVLLLLGVLFLAIVVKAPSNDRSGDLQYLKQYHWLQNGEPLKNTPASN